MNDLLVHLATLPRSSVIEEEHDIFLLILCPAAYAEIFLLVMVCVILIADLFLSTTAKTLTYLLVQLTLLGCVADHRGDA